jgi:6-pyruvoyltetrahydropterin/6-carboxytetrahydropterin synthase
VKAELSKTFRFDAGHRLPNVPPDHRCARPHGHSYRLTVVVAGEVDRQAGWVMDYGRINQAVEPLLRQLDHVNLNEVEGLHNPTSEHIAQWLWESQWPNPNRPCAPIAACSHFRGSIQNP